MLSPLLKLLPSSWHGFQGQMFLWQLPLITIFAIDPGIYVAAYWLAGYGWLALKRWWVNTPVLMALLGSLFLVQPPPSAEFFIGMLVVILPMAWRPEKGQVLSPVGLTPTIFLVGSVFIFHIQFFILLLIFIWLLGFLMWFSMTFAGWSLKDIRIRWGMLAAVSLGGSGLVVLIFALVPKIDTGAIPSFARSSDQIKLTDRLSAEGFRNLLGDDSVAFRAFPLDEIPELTPYWRVFTLDQQTSDGWRRGQRPKRQYANVGFLDASYRQFDLMAEGHDMTWLPIPGWPVPGVNPQNQVTLYAEIRSPRGTIHHAKVAAYDHTSSVTADPRAWRGTTLLSDEGQIGPWARQQRSRFASDQDFARFLMARFQRDFTYSTTTSYDAGSSTIALDQFFFEGLSGYCSFFAQSMATALRAVGIPAQVVTGYMGGDWNDFGGYWMIRNNMAHAWVEAYFSNEGWVRFDPTLLVAPGIGGGFSTNTIAQGQSMPSNAEQGDMPNIFVRASMWVDSLNTNITRSIMQFGGQSNRSFKSRIQGMDFETLIWILGGMMVSILLVTAGTTVVRRMGIIGRHPGLRLEQQFVQILEQAMPQSAPRHHSEGMIAYANRLSAQSGFAEDFHAMALRISKARFGGVLISREETQEVMAALSDLRKNLKQNKT